MRKLTNGINGPFVGKVGTVVGSSRKGIRLKMIAGFHLLYYEK
jgi:hypothetical protein